MLDYTDVDEYKAYSTLLLLISSFVCRLRQIPRAFSCRGAPAAVAAVHQAAKLTRLVKGMLLQITQQSCMQCPLEVLA